MSRRWIVAAWAGLVVCAALVAVHARYLTDLSAFLPAHPTPMQRLLVDQLRTGPGSRLLLIALEGADPAARARISAAMARRLREDREFESVGNGEQLTAERDREFLFDHRYLLSEAVTPEHFSTAGLAAAIKDTISDLASPEGLALEPLVTHDPTGEMLRIVDRLSATRAPATRDGVWTSSDGARTPLVAETSAAGSDTDAQQHALEAIREAFAAAVRAAKDPETRAIRLLLSGPGKFAVESRARIEHAVVRLSIASSAIVVVILLAVYRSFRALILGLLPVATGAVAGIAAVALGFGAVHGITLGFGITLIGEAVDYSIYFFIQSRHEAPPSGALDPLPWERRLWPTLRLGMLTSVCGFATLLPSGFPGLAQLGAYSISGLAAAAAVTRFVLPQLLPGNFAIHDLAPAGARAASLIGTVRRAGPAVLWTAALVLACGSLLVLALARAGLWSRELSSLSPIPPSAQRLDAELRKDLGAPDSLDMVVVSGSTLEAVLRGAESAARALEPLIGEKVIGGFDSPANYLPSLAVQGARRASLPDPAALRRSLEDATRGLALDADRLGPFLSDVEAARHAPLITEHDLAGTSLGSGLRALTLSTSGRWDALLPLYAAGKSPIDLARVRAALAAQPGDARLLDLKQESDALYGAYLRDAMRLSLAGLSAIVVLLVLALRSAGRALRVLAPLVLAVLVVAAALALCQVHLTILHLVGMLLIVAIGSNYALFFDRRSGGESGSTLASLGVANLCTAMAFGLLSFSGVPVLEALGTTVAPGALLALIFSSLLTPAQARTIGSPAMDAHA